MQIKASQLNARLQKGLAPVYLLTGDEPLQMGEAADSIRAAARKAGYSSRQILEVGPHFDWNQLSQEANSMSLFAEQKIIDMRIPSGKPGKEGGKALLEYCQRIPPDTLLLLSLGKLDKRQLGSKWCKALGEAGLIVQIWPVDRHQLPAWIDQRMRANGLGAEPGVTEMLADQVEGNMLAARQEIDKLVLQYGNGKITLLQLSETLSDSARFNVFGLVDSALDGNSSRCIRMLAGLRAEGMAEAVVLWALAREIRTMATISHNSANGMRAEQAMAQARVWSNRQPLVRKALKRLRVHDWEQLLRQCQYADTLVKGVVRSDPWLVLEQITLAMCGVHHLPLDIPA